MWMSGRIGNRMGTGGGRGKVLKGWEAGEIGEMTQYFAIEKGLNGGSQEKRPGSRGCKIREAGGLDRRKCIFVVEVCFLERGE